ncbi:MAG: ATP-binding cassette domain-containing protein [Alphaproteobacteria bacterium]|nr:ATP-binding cassette domain-containing protein [Alphaproteobacteria bacterium]
MINVEDVFIVFYAGTPLERVALRGVNFSIKDGEIVSILGNNGAGRTSLLRFLAGHISLNFGRLWYNGIDITTQTLSERSNIFSSAFFNSELCVAEELTVLENLIAATFHHKNMKLLRSVEYDSMRDKFYDQLRNLKFMDMEKYLDEKASHLAKPYKQMLALLMAIIKKAKVLLIDEISTGLDIESSRILLTTMNKLIKANKMTTIMTINDPEFAINNSDRIIVMNYGQIVADFQDKEKIDLKMEDLFLALNKKPENFDKNMPMKI